MLVKCTDKYKNKELEIIKWTFVFTGLGEILGKFLIYAESEDAYEVGRAYEMNLTYWSGGDQINTH